APRRDLDLRVGTGRRSRGTEAVIDGPDPSLVGLHSRLFGEEPRYWSSAPGRVNLIGEHTDYNGGFVLPIAISRRCRAVASLSADPGTAEVYSAQAGATGERASFRVGDASMKGRGWAAYAAGVLAQLSPDPTAPGLSITVGSDVPLGAGLSSSASFEVAVGAAAALAWGIEIEPMALARACRRAEHEYAGVPCGLMDQAISCLAHEGHALLLDCRDETFDHVPLPRDDAYSLLVANTGVRHTLGDGEYRKRVELCGQAAAAIGVPSLRDATAADLDRAAPNLSGPALRCARHVLSENARTLHACEALRRRAFDEFGRLMFESHRSLRDDYRVSCPELDFIVEFAAGKAVGARMTGGGFGGSAMLLVESAQADELARALSLAFHQHFGHACDILNTAACRGVRSGRIR
ncbi:MAG: galactokinase, partial [Phycisphaerales bacterium]